MTRQNDSAPSAPARTVQDAVIRARVAGGLRSLSDRELNEKLREGFEEWIELQDTLSAEGVLPQRSVAERLLGFLEERYPGAEAARIEGVVRSLRAERERPGRGRGLGL